jgi:hypothetical protein
MDGIGNGLVLVLLLLTEGVEEEEEGGEAGIEGEEVGGCVQR